MKAIFISQEQFNKMTSAVIDEYIAKMKKAAHDEERNYSTLRELADRLTIVLAFGLLENKLFNKGGESDE